VLPRGGRSGISELDEREGGALGVGSEQRLVLVAGDERQPEHTLVEVRAARQVADREPDGVDAQGRVDRSGLAGHQASEATTRLRVPA
jgi:hypothetical protein